MELFSKNKNLIDIKKYIDKSLLDFIKDEKNETLKEIMLHSLAGGKRIRPIISYLTFKNYKTHLDYIAVGKINFNKTKSILSGILKGCKISNCELIGGETAEMPGIYSKDKFDLAGFSVGIVSKKKILNKKNVKNENLILAIPSSGIHSNGYSLVRAILKKNKIPKILKKELLKPTKIYTEEILKLVNKNLVNSAAHITGGGLIENLTRSVPKNLSINIDLAKIKTKKIFRWLKSKNISDDEMLKTFNCGVGFCIIVDKKNVKKIQKFFSKDYMPYVIGHISQGQKKINIYNNIKW